MPEDIFNLTVQDIMNPLPEQNIVNPIPGQQIFNPIVGETEQARFQLPGLNISDLIEQENLLGTTGGAAGLIDLNQARETAEILSEPAPGSREIKVAAPLLGGLIGGGIGATTAGIVASTLSDFNNFYNSDRQRAGENLHRHRHGANEAEKVLSASIGESIVAQSGMLPKSTGELMRRSMGETLMKPGESKGFFRFGSPVPDVPVTSVPGRTGHTNNIFNSYSILGRLALGETVYLGSATVDLGKLAEINPEIAALIDDFRKSNEFQHFSDVYSIVNELVDIAESGVDIGRPEIIDNFREIDPGVAYQRVLDIYGVS